MARMRKIRRRDDAIETSERHPRLPIPVSGPDGLDSFKRPTKRDIPMKTHLVAAALLLSLLAGCRSSTANRQAYYTQPVAPPTCPATAVPPPVAVLHN